MSSLPAFYSGADNALACIFSVSGTSLTDQERALFQRSNPFGFILFARNCETPNQVQKLVAALKECVGRECPILIDQEGGRVQRLKPPHWSASRPMKFYGSLFSKDPGHARIGLQNDADRLSVDLLNVGVNVNCAPVLDVLTSRTHDVIGDRAFSNDPAIVADLGLVASRRYLDNGIIPVVKHLPGHGRATSDSHKELPVVDASLEDLKAADFKPFQAIAESDIGHAVWGMTAHVLFEAIDPDRPVTLSARGIEVLREDIGFDGVLMGDDLDMKALDPYGSIAERCVMTLDAGCDLALYCWADLQIMQDIAEICPKLRPDTLKRLQKAGEVWEKVA